ncbi:MAG: hypothetical protein RL508_1133 [Actinomycetota bacterium]|jgi:mycothiol system anti-sigma-R factor
MTEFNCQETKKHVHEFLQQELSDAEMNEVAAHLAHCESCEGDYGFEHLFNTVIQRSCNEAPPAELASRIMARVREINAEAGK